MPLLRGVHSGAKTLLAHFHYINDGQMPFELDWSAEEVPKGIAKVAELDANQTIFVKHVAHAVHEKSMFV
jgi:hypothetical protein